MRTTLGARVQIGHATFVFCFRLGARPGLSDIFHRIVGQGTQVTLLEDSSVSLAGLTKLWPSPDPSYVMGSLNPKGDVGSFVSARAELTHLGGVSLEASPPCPRESEFPLHPFLDRSMTWRTPLRSASWTRLPNCAQFASFVGGGQAVVQGAGEQIRRGIRSRMRHRGSLPDGHRAGDSRQPPCKDRPGAITSSTCTHPGGTANFGRQDRAAFLTRRAHTRCGLTHPLPPAKIFPLVRVEARMLGAATGRAT